jgi:hypothetical protein
MIEHLEDKKLQINEELIGQFKQQLDIKIKGMIDAIVQEFNGGQPPAGLINEIQSTLHLLISFNLPLSNHKYGKMKTFI